MIEREDVALGLPMRLISATLVQHNLELGSLLVG